MTLVRQMTERFFAMHMDNPRKAALDWRTGGVTDTLALLPAAQVANLSQPLDRLEAGQSMGEFMRLPEARTAALAPCKIA